MNEKLRNIEQGEKSSYVEQAENVIYNYNNQKTSIAKTIGETPSKQALIGRTVLIKNLRDELERKENSHCRLLLNAEGGIGKTAVAANFYHQYFTDYQHLIWLFVVDDFDSFIVNFADNLKIPTTHKTSKILTQEVVTLINDTLKQPILLVLDNMNQPELLVRLQNELLSKINQAHILITSRCNNVKEYTAYEIPLLDKEDAKKVFIQYYDENLYDESHDETLYQIFEAIDYNTQVIEVLAKNLLNFNNPFNLHYEVNDLLLDLQNNGVLQLSKSDAVATKKYAKAKPAAIFKAMFNINELIEQEKQLLQLFAFLPSVNIPYEHLKDILPNIENLDKNLLNLSEKGWLKYFENEKAFKCNHVIQEVCLDNARQKNEFLNTFLDSIYDKLYFLSVVTHLC